MVSEVSVVSWESSAHREHGPPGAGAPDVAAESSPVCPGSLTVLGLLLWTLVAVCSMLCEAWASVHVLGREAEQVRAEWPTFRKHPFCQPSFCFHFSLSQGFGSHSGLRDHA